MTLKTFQKCQFCFYVKKLFVSEKTHKSDNCLKKFLKLKWYLFFDSMHFRPYPAPSGGFLRKSPRKFGIHLNRAK